MLSLLHITTTALQAPPASNLTFFGVWSVGAGAVSEPSPGIIGPGSSALVNLLFDVDDTATLSRLHSEGFRGTSLLHIREVLFYPRAAPLRGLRSDYAARWAATLLDLRPLLLRGVASGVFLGDELAWDCVPHVDLTTAANHVRATLPSALPNGDRPIIFYNEAFPPFDDVALWNATCGPAVALASAGGGYPKVPDAIDWISLDYYPNEGTFLGAQRIYREQLYPKLAPHQRVLFVPPTYGCSSGSTPEFASRFCCSNATRDGRNPDCHGNCTTAMAAWAQASYDWARSDPRFIGLVPWHWAQPGFPSASSWPPQTSMEPGLGHMSEGMRELWAEIGREIRSGRLGEVGARRNTVTMKTNEYEYYCTGKCNAPLPAGNGHGGIVYGGGGTDIDAGFVFLGNRSNGGQLLVLRTGPSGDDAYDPYIYDLGGHSSSAATLILKDKAASSSPTVLSIIGNASAIFVAGGDQAGYWRQWHGTAVQRAVQARLDAGAPIGGTSAGDAVLAAFCNCALSGSVTSEEALKNPYDAELSISGRFFTIPGDAQPARTVNDMHFVTRDRAGRLLAMMARMLQDKLVNNGSNVRGIGIDERTSLLALPSGAVTIAGEGTAYFYEIDASTQRTCEKNVPLSVSSVTATRLDAANLGEQAFDLSTWRGSGSAVSYTFAIEDGTFKGGKDTPYGPTKVRRGAVAL